MRSGISAAEFRNRHVTCYEVASTETKLNYRESENEIWSFWSERCRYAAEPPIEPQGNTKVLNGILTRLRRGGSDTSVAGSSVGVLGGAHRLTEEVDGGHLGCHGARYVRTALVRH